MKKRNVWLLGLVSLINDTSSKLIEPLLPLFIVSLGGGGTALGLISGVSDSVAALFEMLSGYWSDKIKKQKVFVTGGYLTSAISKLGLAFSTGWGYILGLKSIERIGKGIRAAPRDALLASSTKKSVRGRYFGIHRAFDSGGSVLGSILALILFWGLGLNFETLFIVAGLLGIFSITPLFFVKEKKATTTKKIFKLKWHGVDKRLKWFFVTSGLFSLANFSYMFFVLKVQDFLTGSLFIAGPLMLYILYQISYTAFSVPAGILSDKLGRKNMLIIGYALFVLVCIGFMFLNNLILSIVLFILYGIMYAFVNATERAYVSDLSSEKMRGTALGTYYLFTSLALLPGGVISGLLWNLNKTYTFLFGAGVALITLILFTVVSRKNFRAKKDL
ncbi:MFS transporter [Candidatus Woesearchaeota archaeon CG_4_10_14_0_2_um_filter_33_13]|nr:MAG: MFS transporter [Candidatus Woesearchaeota archaeon CG_4_10_14_0_2_um_filter_33_13]